MTELAPGWYDDGTGTGTQRWWDGNGWTEHTAPAAPSPAAPSQAAAAVPSTLVTSRTAPDMPQAGPAKKRPMWPFVVGGAALLVLILIIAGVVGAVNGVRSNAGHQSGSGGGTTTQSPSPSATPTQESTASFYDSRFSTFTPGSQSGSGDGVVPIPAGAKYAVVTATHTGSSNFVVEPLDSSNQPAGLLVNVIGNYSGSTLLGAQLSTDAKVLKITADGAWTVKIAPVSTAPELPASGSGDGVFLYNGDAPIWQITNAGDSNFVVEQLGSTTFPNLLVNEIGTYSGTVPGAKGPSIVTVGSNGAWTIAKQ